MVDNSTASVISSFANKSMLPMSHDSLTSKREITTSSMWSVLVCGLPRSRIGDLRPISFPDICQSTDKRITSLAMSSTNPKQTLLHISVRPKP